MWIRSITPFSLKILSVKGGRGHHLPKWNPTTFFKSVGQRLVYLVTMLMDSSHTCFNLNHTFSSSHTMHKLPSILIMCWDYLNILFWQRQPITPSTVHILLHILDLLLKLQQLLLAAWRWSPCPPSSPSSPPPTTWLCRAWCFHWWWQDCRWLTITKNTIVKRLPMTMGNETKMTNMIKVTRKTGLWKRGQQQQWQRRQRWQNGQQW